MLFRSNHRPLFFVFILLFIPIFEISIKMADESNQEWGKGERSALVCIGNHKLYVSIAGLDHQQNEPVVVLMQSIGNTIDS